MNGLNLAQLPAQTQAAQMTGVDELDPLKILEDQRKRAIQQLESDVAQQQQLITRKSRNQMDILQRKYQIEVAAMRRKFEGVPQSQRDEKFMQRARNDWIRLNAHYAMQEEQIQGKVQPDLQDLEMAKQQQLQQLQRQQEEKLIKINHIKELEAKGIITDPTYSLQEQYAVAGLNVPITAFTPKDPLKRAREFTRAMIAAAMTGDTEKMQRLQLGREGSLEQLSPDTAEAFRKAGQLSGLETRRKRKRGIEEPGTFAEGIIKAKNKKMNVSALRGFAHPKMLTEKEKPIYQRDRTTGQTRVSYNKGETWQIIG